MIEIQKLFKSYLFYMMSAFGISLTIKASVGVSSFNSMNLAFSNAFGIKVGTMTMGINLIFLLIYMGLTGFDHKKKYAIQLISFILFGSFINFFTYSVLGNLVIGHYGLRLLTVAAGTTIGGIAIGMIISYNTITFPIESVCVELEKRTRPSFAFYRYGVDVFSVSVSILVSLLYSLPMYVREGTIISLVIFTFTMNRVKNKVAQRSQMKASRA